MIEEAKRLIRGRAGGGTKRQPDREGVVLGLSPSGFHELAYADWGPLDDKRPVICVHGLTRRDAISTISRSGSLRLSGLRAVSLDVSPWHAHPDLRLGDRLFLGQRTSAIEWPCSSMLRPCMPRSVISPPIAFRLSSRISDISPRRNARNSDDIIMDCWRGRSSGI